MLAVLNLTSGDRDPYGWNAQLYVIEKKYKHDLVYVMYSVSSRLMYGMLKTREKSENDLVSDHKQTKHVSVLLTMIRKSYV